MEQISELKDLLLSKLNGYGFKKKKKNFFIRKVGDCTQHISILETKTKGIEKIHIRISVGFTYEIVEKAISFIQYKKYDNRWATANINLATLMDSKKTYGFYINNATNVSPIVEDIISNVKEYAFEFWDSCNTMNNFYKKLLSKDEIIRMSTFTLNRPEWNLLALSIILQKDSYDKILNEYQEDFNKNNYVLEQVKERIVKYDVVKERILL